MSTSSAVLLSGSFLAQHIRADVVRTVQLLRERYQLPRPPGLAVVMAENDGRSLAYVRAKRKAALECGFQFTLHCVPRPPADEGPDADVGSKWQLAIQEAVSEFNHRSDVDGVIVQLPLPNSVAPWAVLRTVLPDKDVDGLHPHNLGEFLASADAAINPCCALGVRMLLDQYGIPTCGLRVAVVGKGTTAGRPLATMMAHGDATVTLCHARTHDLAACTRDADILISAVGSPGLITEKHVRPGAVLIDCGISVDSVSGKRLLGDIAPSARAIAAAHTPVPGGVGPMTVSALLWNCTVLYASHFGVPLDSVPKPIFSVRAQEPFRRLPFVAPLSTTFERPATPPPPLRSSSVRGP